ncbi:MAG: hypothetical protein AAFU55_06870 [Pseudomonadota bacterium]
MDFYDVIEADERGYGRYFFSYVPKSGGGAERVVFEGVGIARLEGGLLLDYDEIANPYTGLSMMGLSDARIARFAAKQAKALRLRPEAADHFA